MKILFKNTYKSITPFDPVEDIPELLILTGVNGSGKSHLLNAIEKKNVIIDGYEGESIVYFDNRSFNLVNEVRFNFQEIATEKDNAWNIFKNKVKQHVANGRQGLTNIGNIYEEMKEECTLTGIPLWQYDEEKITDIQARQLFLNWKTNIEIHFQNDGDLKNNKEGQAILVLLKSLPYAIDEIDEINFKRLYKPYSFKNRFLPIQLGRIIWDYYSKLDRNDYNVFRNTTHGTSHLVFSKEEFEKTYGPRPWELINNILDTFSSIDYRVNSPETLDPYLDYFQLQLKEKNGNLVVEFDDLSSGEKVLMALVASIYKSTSDMLFPKVLLLDEIDASLHPSMIQNLINVLQDVFIKRGTKVILVTHSATTIALAPDESVYIMNKNGNRRIEKKPKSEALSILTEGIATLGETLTLLDSLNSKKLTIFSEGNNITYLNKAIDLLDGSLKNSVEIISGIESKSGKDILRQLFLLFCKMEHSKKILFVWDPDVRNDKAFNDLKEQNNTYPFILAKKPENITLIRGVESLFNEALLTDEFYAAEKTDGKGGKYKELLKAKFAEHIITTGTKDDFVHFMPIIEKIKNLITS